MLESRLQKGEEYKSLIDKSRKGNHDQMGATQQYFVQKVKNAHSKQERTREHIPMKKVKLDNEMVHKIEEELPEKEEGRFKTVLDFRKTVRNIEFGRDLPRKPLIQSSSNAVGRYARSYNVNWKGVEKRHDLNCIEFGRTKGRHWDTQQYQPSSTDGYYDVIEYVAHKEANTNRGKSRDKITSSRFYQTSSDMRTTAQRSRMSNSRSGYVIDFKKNLPRSIQNKSKLPTFMQKGTSCSRFSVEHIRADPLESDDYTVLQQHTETHVMICPKRDDSFDEFFGDA